MLKRHTFSYTTNFVFYLGNKIDCSSVDHHWLLIMQSRTCIMVFILCGLWPVCQRKEVGSNGGKNSEVLFFIVTTSTTTVIVENIMLY